MVKLCTIKNCNRPFIAKGYCRVHYNAKYPERIAWYTMKARCSPNNKWQRPYYYDRGIRVCDEWLDNYEAFFEHVGIRPTPLHSLDRIDNNKNYEPGNVRWATKREQSANTRIVKNYPGISRHTRTNGKVRWTPRFKHGDKLLSLGSYETEEEAIAIRIATEIELTGDYTSY